MKLKKPKRIYKNKKTHSKKNEFYFIALACTAIFIAVIGVFLSTHLTKAAKYTPYPTPASPGGATPYPTPSTDETVIQFSNPKDNDTVIHNSWVSINAYALDWDGITKMELYTDGKLFFQANSSSIGGLWRAGKPGTVHLLEVRSIDGKGNLASNSIHVIAK